MQANNTTVDFYTSISTVINKSQYFNPFISWFIVTYTYFAIGINGGGPIWKYLFYIVTFGFVASVLSAVRDMATDLIDNSEGYRYLEWIETIFWGLNEWGFVYINYLKLRTCIDTLKKKIWSIIIFITLGTSMASRFFITFKEFNEKGTGQPYHTLIYVPLGLLEICFTINILYFAVKTKDKSKKGIIHIILHSTLSRMLLVSVIYICISLCVIVTDNKVFDVLKRFLWRIKGVIGLVFLLDLLLIRIDLDNQSISNSQQLKKPNGNSLYDDEDDLNGQKKINIENRQKMNVINEEDAKVINTNNYSEQSNTDNSSMNIKLLRSSSNANKSLGSINTALNNEYVMDYNNQYSIDRKKNIERAQSPSQKYKNINVNKEFNYKKFTTDRNILISNNENTLNYNQEDFGSEYRKYGNDILNNPVPAEFVTNYNSSNYNHIRNNSYPYSKAY